MNKQEKHIYISVYHLEQEALDAINKLYRQGFRRDQVSVLAYNTERFNTLYRESAVPMGADEDAVEHVPDEVVDALTPDVVVPAAVAPGLTTEQPGIPYVVGLPSGSLKGFGLGNDEMLAHERSLQEGDILVVLQTDEGQEYRPDLPLIHEEGYAPERKTL